MNHTNWIECLPHGMKVAVVAAPLDKENSFGPTISANLSAIFGIVNPGYNAIGLRIVSRNVVYLCYRAGIHHFDGNYPGQLQIVPSW